MKIPSSSPGRFLSFANSFSEAPHSTHLAPCPARGTCPNRPVHTRTAQRTETGLHSACIHVHGSVPVFPDVGAVADPETRFAPGFGVPVGSPPIRKQSNWSRMGTSDKNCSRCWIQTDPLPDFPGFELFSRKLNMPVE